MEYLSLARVMHVLAVILWIGGVAMVSTVLIPAIKKLKSKEDQLNTFGQIEGRFAFQAKITTVLTGFYMLHALDAWDRYLDHRKKNGEQHKKGRELHRHCAQSIVQVGVVTNFIPAKS